MKFTYTLLILILACSFIQAQATDQWKMKYDSIGRFRPTVAVVVKKDKYGAVDKKGNILIPLEYNKIKEFNYDTAPAKKDSLWGYIKSDQSILIPFIYQDASKKLHGSIAEVKKDGYWGVINLREEGSVLTPFEYDAFEAMDYGYKKAIKGDSIGVIKKGRPFLSAKYTDIKMESNRKLVTTLETSKDKKQLLDPTKHNLAPEPETKMYIHARINESVEIYSDRGDLVAKFESIETYKKGVAIAVLNGEKVYINKIGDILAKVE